MVRRRTFVSVYAVVGLAVLVSGCASLAMDFRVALDPTSISVARGAEGEVTVSISHLIPIDVVPLPITAEIHDPPAFVTATELSIPAGIKSDELTFTVAADAPIGGPTTIEVRTSNGLTTKEQTFELTVVEAD